MYITLIFQSNIVKTTREFLPTILTGIRVKTLLITTKLINTTIQFKYND